MKFTMFSAVVVAFAIVLAQANDCTNGGGDGCAGDDVSKDAVLMLQMKPMTNVLEDDGEDVVAESNIFCINDGKDFHTAAAAEDYFKTECVQRYGYKATLCSGLVHKVFEKFEGDNSAPWKPDVNFCAEINSLLSADAARRLELGLEEVVAPPTSSEIAMLRQSTHSRSGSSSALDNVLKGKPSRRRLQRRRRSL